MPSAMWRFSISRLMSKPVPVVGTITSARNKYVHESGDQCIQGVKEDTISGAKYIVCWFDPNEHGKWRTV